MTDILKSTIIESFRENPGSLEKAMREHEQVVQAIRNRDPQKAFEAMTTHLSITEARLREEFEKRHLASEYK
ncbi:hypothetical protein SDC9_183958 [bioreactor metagenome]|uniref:GntR C-terminal domain-containing protein n=1 Tax=bioreactor metagenome TaxID=1076179 RepID=A0A645HE89_9ZZZZ